MLIDRVRNARVAGVDGLVDIVIDRSRVEAIVPAVTGPATAGSLDVEGRAVVPGLVDAHVHLDKAYQLDALAATGAPIGSVAQAIAATAEVHRGLTVTDLVAAAERLLGRMVRHGTTAARVHVEVSTATGLDNVRWQVALVEDWADRISIQLVAFPQHGLFHEAGAAELLEAALEAGCHVVGGCPYADDDAARHVAHVVDLADRTDRLLDLHIDFTSDRAVHDLDAVVDGVSARRWSPGRVALGHVTSLAAMGPEDALSRAKALAGAGIGVVSLPATDMFLAGAVTPLRMLLDAGVTVAVATNNVANAFTPYGDGSLLQVAWLAGLVGRFPPGPGHQALLDMVTTSPARLLRLHGYGISTGGYADLVVIDAERPTDAVAAPADVVATCHRGRLTFGPALGRR